MTPRKITCYFCGKTIARRRWRGCLIAVSTFKMADGTKEPVHEKCGAYLRGEIDGTAWDIKVGRRS